MALPHAVRCIIPSVWTRQSRRGETKRREETDRARPDRAEANLSQSLSPVPSNPHPPCIVFVRVFVRVFSSGWLGSAGGASAVGGAGGTAVRCGPAVRRGQPRRVGCAAACGGRCAFYQFLLEGSPVHFHLPVAMGTYEQGLVLHGADPAKIRPAPRTAPGRGRRTGGQRCWLQFAGVQATFSDDVAPPVSGPSVAGYVDRTGTSVSAISLSPSHTTATRTWLLAARALGPAFKSGWAL